MIIAFDLDGTLANIEHRLHFIKGDNHDWPNFFRACVDDTPIYPVALLALELESCGHAVDIWSGRSDEVRPQTVEWLHRYGIKYRTLRMRKAGNYLPDHVIKASWLADIPEEEWPDIVFDDRQRVVDMWRKHGIVCCQVAPGNF